MYTRAQIDAWLGPLTDPSLTNAERRMGTVMSRVWTVARKGAVRAIATDAKALVLVAGEYGYDKMPDKAAEWCLGLLCATGSEISVTLDELRGWTGPPPSCEPLNCNECGDTKSALCSKCSGTGKVMCEYGCDHTCPDCNGNGRHECDMCDSKGQVVPEWTIDRGIISGLLIDRRRLAHTLRGCRDQELTISAGEHQLWIHSANMEVVLMGIHGDESPEFKPSIEKG